MNTRSLFQRGLTLVELMVVVAVAAILVLVAAPSLQDFVLMQRLKGINAQLVTDLQFARAEAAARNQLVRLRFTTDTVNTCYVIYTATPGVAPTTERCSCLLGPGNACSATPSMTEVRTVTVARTDRVIVDRRRGIGQDEAFAFDHRTGGIFSIPTDNDEVPLNSYQIDTYIDTARYLRAVVGISGRPTVCSVGGGVTGFPAC